MKTSELKKLYKVEDYVGVDAKGSEKWYVLPEEMTAIDAIKMVADQLHISKDKILETRAYVLNEGLYLRKTTERAPAGARDVWAMTVRRGVRNTQVDSTEEEATNAETDGTGVSGNDSDMSDGAEGDGAAEQSGDAEGVDRAEAEAAGNSNGNRETEMTEEEWRIFWEDMEAAKKWLYSFFYINDADTLIHGHITKQELNDAYQNAIALAAGLEKMLNGKKYTP